ncbi:hypothetical protein RIF29_42464 [Crotalaria pallida]|uniref:Transmembrane protein n=1 Tax=Crotalaria pallida TaxID=3830 RepID=A0AAN9E6Z3_CROPI
MGRITNIDTCELATSFVAIIQPPFAAPHPSIPTTPHQQHNTTQSTIIISLAVAVVVDVHLLWSLRHLNYNNTN